MDALDMRTALVGMAVTFAACTAIAGALWYQSRERFNGMQWVTGGLGASASGVALIALRDPIPDLLSLSLASILLLVGSLLVLTGLERLVERPRPKHAETLLLIAYAAYSVYFAYDPVDQTFRVFVNALVLGIISGESAWLMLAGVERSLRRLTRDVGLAFAFLTAVHLMRAIGIVMLGAGPTFMRSTSTDVILITLHSAAVVAITFSLALMLYRMLGAQPQTQEGILASAFKASPFAMVLSRLADGTILEVNEAFGELTGYSRDEVIGRTSRDLGIWGHWEDREALITELRSGGGVDRREVEFRGRAGDPIFGMVSMETLRSNGEEYMVTSVVDVSERKRMEDEVRELAIRDQLTGLYNRRGFFAVIEHMAREAERTGARLHLVFMDCDGLKVYEHQQAACQQKDAGKGEREQIRDQLAEREERDAACGGAEPSCHPLHAIEALTALIPQRARDRGAGGEYGHHPHQHGRDEHDRGGHDRRERGGGPSYDRGQVAHGLPYPRGP